MATWSTTATDILCNNMWGNAGKHDINGNNVIRLLRKMNKGASAWNDWRRPVLHFDLDGFPGSSSDITAVILDMECNLVTFAGDKSLGVTVDQVDPQCQAALPDPSQAAEYDPAECDWNEMSAVVGNNWLNAGGDILNVDLYQIDAPTATGPWQHTDAELVDMCVAAIDDWEDDLLLRMKFTDESPSVVFPDTRTNYEFDLVFDNKDDTDWPKITITYTAGKRFTLGTIHKTSKLILAG